MWNLEAAHIPKSTQTLPACKVIAFSADGRRLATAGDDRSVQVWDLAAKDLTASAQKLAGHPNKVTSMFFVDDKLVTWDNWVARLWNVATPDGPAQPSCLLPAYQGVRLPAVAASADGQWLIEADASGGVLAWNLAGSGDHCIARRLLGEKEKANLVAISPDSRWAIAAGQDGTARLWDLAASDPAASPVLLSGHGSEIIAMVASPDSRWLITGSLDKTVRIWEITADQREETAGAFRA